MASTTEPAAVEQLGSLAASPTNACRFALSTVGPARGQPRARRRCSTCSTASVTETDVVVKPSPRRAGSRRSLHAREAGVNLDAYAAAPCEYRACGARRGRCGAACAASGHGRRLSGPPVLLCPPKQRRCRSCASGWASRRSTGQGSRYVQFSLLTVAGSLMRSRQPKTSCTGKSTMYDADAKSASRNVSRTVGTNGASSRSISPAVS